MNINNSLHLDLNNGWNALKDEIPSGADFIFSHPPYWDIIKYENQRNSYSPDDLSNNMTYEEFIEKLNMINEKIYHSLVNGGRHAILVGDVRKNGKYYSIIKVRLQVVFGQNINACELIPKFNQIAVFPVTWKRRRFLQLIE